MAVTKQRMTELWAFEGPDVAVTNLEIIMQMFLTCRKEIECSLLLGAFLEQLHRKVSLKRRNF